MDDISFLLFHLKLACHLVVSASFKRFGETVGSYRQNLRGKERNLFRSLSPQLKSDGNLDINKSMCPTESSAPPSPPENEY